MRALPALSILCAAAVLSLAGCANTSEAPLAAAPSSTPDAVDVHDTVAPVGPVEAYLDWLAASREPDAPRACSLMTDELQARMLTEFSASLGTDFPNCEAMITETAALYSAAGASAEVDVAVVSETATEATLFSTYIDSGKCGTVHLSATGTGWMLTEQVEECAS